MKGIIVCFLASILLCACPLCYEDMPKELDKSVCVINNSSDTIHLAYTQDANNIMLTPISFERWWKVAPSDSLNLELFDYSEGDYNYDYSSSFVQIIILKQKTIERYTFEEIEKNEIVDKRYILMMDRVVKDGGMRIVYND